jgi:hypothetical protein
MEKRGIPAPAEIPENENSDFYKISKADRQVKGQRKFIAGKGKRSSLYPRLPDRSQTRSNPPAIFVREDPQKIKVRPQ